MPDSCRSPRCSASSWPPPAGREGRVAVAQLARSSRPAVGTPLRRRRAAWILRPVFVVDGGPVQAAKVGVDIARRGPGLQTCSNRSGAAWCSERHQGGRGRQGGPAGTGVVPGLVAGGTWGGAGLAAVERRRPAQEGTAPQQHGRREQDQQAGYRHCGSYQGRTLGIAARRHRRRRWQRGVQHHIVRPSSREIAAM